MITEIGAKKTFNAKIWGIPVFLVLVVGSIYLIIYDTLPQKAVIPILCSFAFLITIVSVILFFILEILYIPNGLIIDHEQKELTLKYFTNKQKVIPVSDINAYKKIQIRTKAGPCYGVVMYLSNGKPVLLSDLSLDGYLPVKKFLDDQQIDSIGEGDFSFMPYFMHQ